MNPDQRPDPTVLLCSLQPEELAQRGRDWRVVNEACVERTVQPGLLTRRYRREPEIAESLRRLIAAEAECCPFLRFEVQDVDGQLQLEVTTTQSGADAVLEALASP
jgi:hypothetical protein